MNGRTVVGGARDFPRAESPDEWSGADPRISSRPAAVATEWMAAAKTRMPTETKALAEQEASTDGKGSGQRSGMYDEILPALVGDGPAPDCCQGEDGAEPGEQAFGPALVAEPPRRGHEHPERERAPAGAGGRVPGGGSKLPGSPHAHGGHASRGRLGRRRGVPAGVSVGHLPQGPGPARAPGRLPRQGNNLQVSQVSSRVQPL